MTRRLTSFLLGLALLATGCGCTSVDPAFLAGERAAYNAIAPGYATYILEDEELDDEQKTDRQRTLAAWDWALSQWEKKQAGK